MTRTADLEKVPIDPPFHIATGKIHAGPSKVTICDLEPERGRTFPWRTRTTLTSSEAR